MKYDDTGTTWKMEHDDVQSSDDTSIVRAASTLFILIYLLERYIEHTVPRVLRCG